MIYAINGNYENINQVKILFDLVKTGYYPLPIKTIFVTSIPPGPDTLENITGVPDSNFLDTEIAVVKTSANNVNNPCYYLSNGSTAWQIMFQTDLLFVDKSQWNNTNYQILNAGGFVFTIFTFDINNLRL